MTRENLKPLMDAPEKWTGRAGQNRSLEKRIRDLNPGAPGARQTYGGRERLGDQRLAQAVRCVACLGACPSNTT